MSLAEKILFDSLVLTVPKEEIVLNYRPNWLKNPSTGCNLELDFYIERLNLAIELQGEKHFTCDSTKQRDHVKSHLCDQIGIKLLIITLNQIRPSIIRRKLVNSSYNKGLARVLIPYCKEKFEKQDLVCSKYLKGINYVYGESKSLKSCLQNKYDERWQKFKNELRYHTYVDVHQSNRITRGKVVGIVEKSRKVSVKVGNVIEHYKYQKISGVNLDSPLVINM